MSGYWIAAEAERERNKNLTHPERWRHFRALLHVERLVEPLGALLVVRVALDGEIPDFIRVC